MITDGSKNPHEILSILGIEAVREKAEPADFQRGEVEVDGRNLYFNEWEADSEVERTPATP